MIENKSDLRLRRATPRDLDLVFHWLARPGIRRWWGKPTLNQRDVRAYLEIAQQLAHPYLIVERQRTIGYVQIAHASWWSRRVGEWPGHLPTKAWILDILLADSRYRGRGRGPWAIRETIAKVQRKGLSEPVFAWVMKDNVRSLRAFEKVGFQIVNEPESATLIWALLRLDG